MSPSSCRMTRFKGAGVLPCQGMDESFDREARLKPALEAEYDASNDHRLKPRQGGAKGRQKCECRPRDPGMGRETERTSGVDGAWQNDERPSPHLPPKGNRTLSRMEACG